MSNVNKNYYEFIFISNLGKTCTLKIPNAVLRYSVNDLRTDMNSIINLNVIQTSSGSPAAKKLVRFTSPSLTVIPVS